MVTSSARVTVTTITPASPTSTATSDALHSWHHGEGYGGVDGRAVVGAVLQPVAQRQRPVGSMCAGVSRRRSVAIDHLP